jgi:hypothetical protein|uniref:Phage protein n=2 Tax=unclassified Caudoviricetes TaxID=2788787 RepID=A0A8S5TEB9_9CAUD|nr:MAG TPA: Protein of unknown function (DUF1642) [Myoviridae sp. ctdv95]DAF61601.1 MAG TPA: Protein of unknown function (DUF1642) [Siphoviridae sp. ctzEO1]
MNEKQITELIERMRELGHIYSYQGAKNLIREYEKLNKPEKVKVPQFVADYIEESRLKGWDLLASMCFVVSAKNKKTTKWFYLGENKNIFALAWIFGYDVEEEKRYLVKMKDVEINFNFLNRHRNENYWIFSSKDEHILYQTHHTRKELEEAGFGWVFNCEGIEIEEVVG